MKSLALLLVASTAGLLAGCGGSAPPPGGKDTKPAVGIYTSALDCSTSGKATLSDCDKLIASAIKAHTTNSKTYISERLCEATEGINRCERMSAGVFRPQLLAFVVTFSKQPTAQPLYAPADKAVLGFTTGDKKTTLLSVDEELLFSDDARVVAATKIGR
jgi:uncharacterized protein YgiB involved in biofilm formation